MSPLHHDRYDHDVAMNISGLSYFSSITLLDSQLVDGHAMSRRLDDITLSTI